MGEQAASVGAQVDPRYIIKAPGGRYYNIDGALTWARVDAAQLRLQELGGFISEAAPGSLVIELDAGGNAINIVQIIGEKDDR